MPIHLVDGAMNIRRTMLNWTDFYSALEEMEEFYKHPKDLDGEQDPDGKDYGESYWKRSMQEFTDWHTSHGKALLKRTGCRSALDAGCGTGNIVRGLLRNGIEAYGLELDHYAVDHCAEELRGRIVWGDLTKVETLPRRMFDLVIAYDVLEHAPLPETCVGSLCSLSSRWIHVKVPDIRGLNLEESRKFDPTHITGRSLRWWIDEFGKNGFSLTFDEAFTKLKWDPEYAYAAVGAPDLYGLFRRGGYR